MLGFAAPAIAQQVDARPAVELPSLAAVAQSSFGAYIHVQGGARPGDGGGGYYFRNGLVCTPDGVTILKDFSGNCFFQQPNVLPLTPQSLGAKCDGVTDDTAAFVAAQSASAALGPLTLNSGTCYIASNTTLTRTMFFSGGVIKPGLTVTINAIMQAPDGLQIFDTTGGGLIRGNPTITKASVMWWGASNTNTNATLTRAAFQAAVDFAQAGANLSTLEIAVPPGTFNLGSGALPYGIQFNASNWCPILRGSGPGNTNINFTPSSEAGAFLLNSAISQCGFGRGGIYNLRVSGNTNTVGCWFASTNSATCQIQLNTVETGALFCSCTNGGFVENSCFALLEGSSGYTRVLDYRTNSGGTGSFRETGTCLGEPRSFVGNPAASANAFVLVENGSNPYSVPLPISLNIQSGGASYFIDNQSANLVSTYGDIQVEVDGTSSLTLAKTGGISIGGSFNKNISGGSSCLNYGPVSWATIAGTVGSGTQSFQNTFRLLENSSCAVQFLTAGTGATTTITSSTVGPSEVHLNIYNASTYNWSGRIDICANGLGAYNVCGTAGHRFAGTNDPTFAVNGSGQLQITVGDTVTASSTRLFGVIYTAGEEQ